MAQDLNTIATDKSSDAPLPSRETVIGALSTVIDPELGMDIWSLGLVYEIVIETNKIKIKMTLTTPLCPYGPELMEQVKQTLLTLTKLVEIDLVFEPAWQPTDELKMMFGV